MSVWDKFFFIKKKFLKSFVVCTSYHVLCEKNYYTFAEENLDFFVVFKQFQYTLGCMIWNLRHFERKEKEVETKNLIWPYNGIKIKKVK